MNLTRFQILIPSLVAVTLAAAVPGCGSDQKTKKAESAPAAAAAPAQPLTVEDSARVKMTARVKAINLTSRVVTLEGASGRTVSLVAGSEVRRLNEVKVGDTVAVEYQVSVLAELRPPTASEAASPITTFEIAGRSPQGAAPAAGVAQGVRVVTTVQAVDQPKLLVTLKGPGGDMITVQGRKPENVAKLKVGDTIVITYTESAAISLEKTGK